MKVLFWNVDTQKDFMNKDGALYVEGAESIKSNLKKLTSMATNYGITVVNTMDCHDVTDEELSDTPDFMETFPKHCMRGTTGSEFIEETLPVSNKNVIIKKNKFDVFTGNADTERIVEEINPEVVVVYGVATNVCVNFAILGLRARGYNVIVIKDAIKELPQLDVKDIYEGWVSEGVIFDTTANIEKLLK